MSLWYCLSAYYFTSPFYSFVFYFTCFCYSDICSISSLFLVNFASLLTFSAQVWLQASLSIEVSDMYHILLLDTLPFRLYVPSPHPYFTIPAFLLALHDLSLKSFLSVITVLSVTSHIVYHYQSLCFVHLVSCLPVYHYGMHSLVCMSSYVFILYYA